MLTAQRRQLHKHKQSFFHPLSSTSCRSRTCSTNYTMSESIDVTLDHIKVKKPSNVFLLTIAACFLFVFLISMVTTSTKVSKLQQPVNVSKLKTAFNVKDFMERLKHPTQYAEKHSSNPRMECLKLCEQEFLSHLKKKHPLSFQVTDKVLEGAQKYCSRKCSSVHDQNDN